MPADQVATATAEFPDRAQLDAWEADHAEPSRRFERVMEGNGGRLIPDSTLVNRITEIEALQAQLMTLQAQDLLELRDRCLTDQDALGRPSSVARDPDGWVTCRVGWVLGLSEGEVRRRLDTARRLARFRRIADLAAMGRLRAWPAEKAVEHLERLSEVVGEERLAEVEAQTADWLAAEPRTVAELNRRMRRIILRAEAEAMDDAAREAALAARHAARDVKVTSCGDGTAALWALLPESDALAVRAALAEAARLACSQPDEMRTQAQVRADSLVAAVTGAMAAYGHTHDVPSARPLGGPAVSVQVQVPVATVVGASQDAGEVPGYGPVPAATVRDLLSAPDVRFGALFYDRTTGRLVGLARGGKGDARLDRTIWAAEQQVATRYGHPEAMRRVLEGRDLVCRAPGCSRAARRCDTDHLVPWPRGRTSLENSLSLCRFHHRLKTHAPEWNVKGDAGGAVTWSTPDGHERRTEPHDYRTEFPDLPPF